MISEEDFAFARRTAELVLDPSLFAEIDVAFGGMDWHNIITKTPEELRVWAETEFRDGYGHRGVILQSVADFVARQCEEN